METASGGEICIDGVVTGLRWAASSASWRCSAIQLIHQDPYSALNPTRTVEAILTDPLNLRAKQTGRDAQWVQRRMHELLELVGLEADYALPRYPHQLSGGMRQRVVIARALTVDPDVLVADEAVSMIDVSLRLGILALLRRLRAELGVSVLFVTHDVATARYIGEDSRIYVLYRGTVVEQGLVDDVILKPVHPYTQSLLSAIPVLRGIEEEAPTRSSPWRRWMRTSRTPAACRGPLPLCPRRVQCRLAASGGRRRRRSLLGRAHLHAGSSPRRARSSPFRALRGALA